MKTAFITGANKSIGFETARQLAQKGFFIYIGSRDLEKGRAAAVKLAAAGLTNIEVIRIDVSDPASIAEAGRALRNRISVLDVLINNAGIRGQGGFQDPLTVDLAIVREVFETNFFGVIAVTQTMIDLLRASSAPRIVNVTSGLASLTLHSDPSWRFAPFKGAAYGPSKTALNAYTVSLAYALKDTPFKVNAVDPGYTATDFNNHRGTGTLEDAASRIVRYALIGEDGPTGKYFSDDNNPATGESPW